MGADNQIYAVGARAAGGGRLRLGGKAETVTQGVPTTGRIPNGGLVEREGPGRLADEKVLVLELRNPDFNTAVTWPMPSTPTRSSATASRWRGRTTCAR